MKQISFCLAMLLLSSMVQAKDLVVIVDGKEIRTVCTTFNHEINDADKGKGSQASAMTSSFLYYGLLAKGDIEGAAMLSIDPPKAADKWIKYRERVGEEFFKKIMNDYFTAKNIILAEVVLAEDTMLVIKTEDGPIAQFYQKKEGKYLVTDKPADGKTLGKVLTMIQEGKIKL